MKSLPISSIRRFIIHITILLLVAGVGYRLGEHHVGISLTPEKRVIVNTETPASVPIDFSLFWDVWQRVHRYYIDAKSIDNQKMVWGAISGMVGALGDPYTIFLPPKENQSFKEDLGGAFEGIGAQLGLKDGHVIVIAPLKGSPAEKAGVKAGDWIIKVYDEDTLGWTVEQTVSKIRGPKGTKVTLSLLHENSQKPSDVTIIRDTITVPSIISWIKQPRDITEISGLTKLPFLSSDSLVAYLHLTRFGDRLNEEWGQAIDTIISEQNKIPLSGMILDLRNNPGGYLDGSVYIGSEFLRSGIVVSQQNSDGTKEDYRVNGKGRLVDIPLVVLINKGSASASEIVAGALKDYKRATLVGETSFGKGSVQTPQDLTGGAGLHVTTGKWLTPKGEWISKKGITPDLEVKDEDAVASQDAQLAKALEILLK
jgi:carboxyl-terminal processing protease